jgi:hypothetical protein
MKRRVPKQQPKMDFPAKNISSGPMRSMAPPRPPFDETFSMLNWLLSRQELSPQPTYPSVNRWRY